MEFNPSVDDDERYSHVTAPWFLNALNIYTLQDQTLPLIDVASSGMGTAGIPTRLFVVMTKD
jgi:hypothetical protein